MAGGDVDGDGDIDLGFAQTGHCIHSPDELLLNDGRGSFSVAPAGRLPVHSDYSQDVALGDVDGDGDLEAVEADRDAGGAGSSCSSGGSTTLLR